MKSDALEGGFSDAPVEAARAFRAAMTVMARPGKIEQLDTARAPAPVSDAAATLLLTLADHETGIHLAGAHDTSQVRAWLAFHTGAPVVGPEAAQFALGTWDSLLPLSQFSIGTAEYPDRSTTLIVEMEMLENAGATLNGPGIRERTALNLPDVEKMRGNNACFPLGLDFFLTSGVRVAALPRSTKIGVA